MSTPEELAIQRRQRIAEMLMRQGQEPIETNQMAGGYVVPVTPLTAISKVAQQLAGATIGKGADKLIGELDTSRRQAAQQATQGYLNDQDRRKAAISAITNEMAPQELKQAALSEFNALNKPKGREGVPSGFVQTEQGAIRPMPVEGFGNYADFLLKQAGAKAQIPGFGEQEKLMMAREDQALQRQIADRNVRIAEENLTLRKKEFERKPDKTTAPIYDAQSDEWVYPPTEENPRGKRTGSQNKVNAVKSADYLVNILVGDDKKPGLIYTTPSGGTLGYKGRIGALTETQKVRRFNNAVQQLSTELRAIYRIPGEGTLTDKDMELHGLQLPDVKNDPNVNQAIVDDLRHRMRIKLETPGMDQKNPEGVPPGAEFKGKVTGIRLSTKAQSMPEDKKALVLKILESGTEQEKVQLLNKGWLEEE